LATLAGEKVTVAFDVNATSVHFAVTTTEERAKWVAILIGTQMINTHSYVAWFDDAEVGASNQPFHFDTMLLCVCHDVPKRVSQHGCFERCV